MFRAGETASAGVFEKEHRGGETSRRRDKTIADMLTEGQII